ncbi:MAG: hypothetical protein HRU43_01755 [Simkaniaceae bacterium]|nr:hypothetical protein [Simkaniaceae bacterium]
MEKYDQLPGFQQGLEEILREGARKMLHQAIEGEVEEFTSAILPKEVPDFPGVQLCHDT